jgi:hypothetical protein
MKPMWLALAVMAGLGAAVDAHAVGRLIDVNVIDRDTGLQLPVIRSHGQYYVVGEPGHRYRVDLQNRRDGQLLGVVSVDGINAISGDTARWSQPGYVLDGYRHFSVLGWRKSEQQVADFLFTDLGQSYAALTGRPDNVGVIGVAVFRQRVEVEQEDAYKAEPQPQPIVRDRLQSAPNAKQSMPAPAPMSEAMPAPSMVTAQAAPARQRANADAGGPLGTGHGEREDSMVHTVDFQRASDTPDEVITIYYDTRARLVARGILPAAPIHTPQAFPGHYAPDP